MELHPKRLQDQWWISACFILLLKYLSFSRQWGRWCLRSWRTKFRLYVSSKYWHLPTSLHGTKTENKFFEYSSWSMMGLSFRAAITVIGSNQRLIVCNETCGKNYKCSLLWTVGGENQAPANDSSLEVLFIIRQQCTGVSKVSQPVTHFTSLFFDAYEVRLKWWHSAFTPQSSYDARVLRFSVHFLHCIK